jgi:HEAT repeats
MRAHLILRKTAIVMFAELLLLALTVQGAKAQSFITNEGDRFEVTLKVDKQTILLKEAIYMSFEFKSYAARDLCVRIGGDYRNRLGRPDSFKVTVTSDGGKSVPQPEVKWSMGGFSGCGRIPAGKTYHIRLFLPHWATFEEPGNYQIRVQRHLGVQPFRGDYSPSIFQANVEATIKVIDGDSEQVGNLIHSLGKAMLESDMDKAAEAASMLGSDNDKAAEAASMLGNLNDERSIPYFAAALQKYSAEPQWSTEGIVAAKAARALSRFQNDSALAALEKAMFTTDEDMRLEIADAFSDSKHPGALKLLLSMRHDDYWFVRLRVAQRLAVVDSAESREILHGLLGDANEDVRNAARNSLEKLGSQ